MVECSEINSESFQKRVYSLYKAVCHFLYSFLFVSFFNFLNSCVFFKKISVFLTFSRLVANKKNTNMEVLHPMFTTMKFTSRFS